MNMITAAIVIVSLCGYAALVCSAPFRRKAMLKKAGAFELPVKPRLIRFAVLVLICCPFLIGLVLLRDMGIFVDCIMCAVGLLGTEMAVREVMTTRCSGVYANGIIAEGRFIPFSDVLGIPLFSLSKKEQCAHDNGILELVTKKRTNLQIAYAGEEECRRVLEKIVELEPRLKP